MVRPHRRLATGSVSIILASILVGLATPWPFAIVIDSVLGKKPLPGVLEPFLGGLGRYWLLAVVVVLGLVLTALTYGLNIIENYVNTKLNLRLVLDFRSALFEHVQRLSLTFHDRVPTGQVMFRLSNQANSVGQIVVGIPPLAESFITAMAMFVIALFIDWQIALVSLVVVPLIVYSAQYYAKRIEPQLYEVRNLEARSQSIIYESVAMVRVIMTFGREREDHRHWRTQAEQANDARLRLTMRQTLFSLVIGTTTAAGAALVTGFGAANVIRGRMTTGELIVLLGYIESIYRPLQQLTTTLGQLQQQFVSFDTAYQLLEVELDITDAPDAVELDRVEGGLTFDGVHFSYGQGGEVLSSPGATDGGGGADAGTVPRKASPRGRAVLEDPVIAALCERAVELGLNLEETVLAPRPPALTDVSFGVRAGQTVAIVGPTGAGKSTLVNLIVRFYDPTRGAVLLDGVDLRRVKLAALRRQISVVLQEPMLFAGTIGDNIRYGRPEASDADVVAAARAANVHDFISSLPEEYETTIGERGSQVSGGERQRISVARAFLMDTPILLLDEPTSSIDSRTESVVLTALERLMEGRTTFIVAHRLSTIRRADLILVLDHGRLVQQGSHDDLLAQGGLYKQLYEAQAGLTDGAWLGNDDNGSRPAERRVPLRALLFGHLLVPAVTTLLENGSADDLRALLERVPKRMRGPGWWMLIGVVVAALRDDSLVPLRQLCARASDPQPDVAVIGQVAASLVRSRAALQAICERLARSSGKDPRQPLDPNMLLSEPWKELGSAYPHAVEAIGDLLPRSGVCTIAVGAVRVGP